MNSSSNLQNSRIIELLAALESDKREMLKFGMEMTGGKGAPIFPLDLVTLGAIKRNLSLTAAIRLMVESSNMVCSRALLRVHIDTSLRYSAAWLVKKPHDFATKILAGDRIDRIKDPDGKRLTDAHLVEVRAADYPWLPVVYERLSGYIHFSGAHIFDSIASLNDESRTVDFEIKDTDLNFPKESWIEVLECFRDATGMLAKYIQGYRLTKQPSMSKCNSYEDFSQTS